MSSDPIPVQSVWDVDFLGDIHDLIIVESSTEAIAYIDSEKLILLTNEMDLFSHDSLFFLEHYKPYCVLKRKDDLTKIAQNELSIVIKNGTGYLSFLPEKESHFFDYKYLNPPEHAICGTKHGLEFLKERGTKTVMIRMEFLNHHAHSDENELLDYACANFGKVYVRLSDNNDASHLDDSGDRGSNFIFRNLLFYEDQMDLIDRYALTYHNTWLVIPYIRNEIELNEIDHIIAGRCKGNVVAMIEIPLMLYRFQEYCEKFTTFIIGVGDMFELLGGFKRKEIKYINQLEEMLTDLIVRYVFPFCTEENTIFITSKRLFEDLSRIDPQCRLIFLAKY